MERFELEFPKDAKKFTEMIEKNFSENGTLGQLFDDLAEALPEKRESILSIPIYVDDGES